MAWYVSLGCVRFARYCGKMCTHHLFLYGRLERPSLIRTLLLCLKRHENLCFLYFCY